jgi:esterase/lipase
LSPRRRAGLRASGVILLIITLAALWSWPAALGPIPARPAIDGPPDAWLAAAEDRVNAVTAIEPGTAKRIRWYAGASNSQTDVAIVYLHGFSATRQEIAPVCDLLADALQANLFETRLSGHGLQTARLAGVTAEDWLADASEALGIGQRIGRRTVLIGTSTGATLALAMRAGLDPQQVAAIITISPNFGPLDPAADALTWPGGPLLARAILGETNSWDPANDAQARYWSTEYPTAAVIEVMRLVKAVRAAQPMTLQQPLLSFLSANDDVIDAARARFELQRISAPVNEIIEIEGTGTGRHVLAGDILAPQNNTAVVQHMLNFLQRALPAAAL